MNKFLLTVHILAAIICVGPVTVAASMFPPSARRMLTAETPSADVLGVLHRISRIYAYAALAVPVFGLAVAGGIGVMDEAWLIVSIVLTVASGAVLGFLVLPAQSRVLAAADAAVEVRQGLVPSARRLSMTTGSFGLLWLVVLVLMVVRPGHHAGG